MGSHTHGRPALPELLPRAPSPLPSPLRGPPRLLRRGAPARGDRRAIWLQAGRLQRHDQPVPWPDPPRRRSPLFLPDGRGRPAGRRRREDPDGPEEAQVADQRALDLTTPRSLRTRVAGLFLFLPLLTRLRFDEFVTAAAYP